MSTTVYKVGINDSTSPVGSFKNGKCKLTVPYRMWKGFLERCYSGSSKYPTYVGCTVHEDWHRYSTFEKWFNENYKEGYVLDKDMKVPGNRVYGPATCVFVPAWLNTFLNPHTKSRGDYLIGVSKIGKKFKSTCHNAGKSVHLGTFLTELEAHEAWRNYKLGILADNKDLINSLSENFYDSLVMAVNSLK